MHWCTTAQHASAALTPTADSYTNTHYTFHWKNTYIGKHQKTYHNTFCSDIHLKDTRSAGYLQQIELRFMVLSQLWGRDDKRKSRFKNSTRIPGREEEREDGEWQTFLLVLQHPSCGCMADSVIKVLRTCSRHNFHEWSCLTQEGRSLRRRMGEEVEPSALTQRRSKNRLGKGGCLK